jgi:hypothetical protein
MKNNHNKQNFKMCKTYGHHLLALLVPSIAIASIIIGLLFASSVNQSAFAQTLSQPQQQNQNTTTNTNIVTASEAARILGQKLGVNSTEVSINPGQNMSDLTQKLAPGGSLANYQQQLKGLGQQLGVNGPVLQLLQPQQQLLQPQQQLLQPQQQLLQPQQQLLQPQQQLLQPQQQLLQPQQQQNQNITDLNQKLAPGGTLSNFQQQLKGLGQQLGVNETLLSQMKQQLPANPMQLWQQLDQVLNYIP